MNAASRDILRAGSHLYLKQDRLKVTLYIQKYGMNTVSKTATNLEPYNHIGCITISFTGNKRIFTLDHPYCAQACLVFKVLFIWLVRLLSAMTLVLEWWETAQLKMEIYTLIDKTLVADQDCDLDELFLSEFWTG